MIKNKLSWLIKLFVLTASIYWFMSDGLQKDVSTSIGLSKSGNQSDVYNSLPLLIIIIGYLGFTFVRSIYRRNVNRPKSEGFKKYQKLKE